MFFHKDPRRVQPLVDHLVHEFESLDFNGESTFAISQVLVFYRAFYEELNWKFTPWIDDMVHRVWGELGCEHDDVSFRKGFSTLVLISITRSDRTSGKFLLSLIKPRRVVSYSQAFNAC